MKKFFCIFTLMFITFIVCADWHDPNSTWDYDSDKDGDCRASAFASEYRGDTFEYFGQGAASNRGDDVADFLVSWSLGQYHDSLQGSFWGPDSFYLNAGTSFTERSSAGGYGSCEYASASVSVP